MWRNAAEVIGEYERKRVAEIGLESIFGRPDARIPTVDEQRAAEEAADKAKRVYQRDWKRRQRQRAREGTAT